VPDFAIEMQLQVAYIGKISWKLVKQPPLSTTDYQILRAQQEGLILN
jgi:hypothetical protein